MSDLDKLSGIIADLENQAGKVREFGGVLSAVNEARKEIESSKTIVVAVAEDQKRLVTDSNSKFDFFSNELRDIQGQLSVLKKDQGNCLQMISEFKFLTPDVFEQSQRESIGSMHDRFIQLTKEIEESTSDLQSSLDSISSSVKSLKVLVIIGLIVSIFGSGAAFMAMKFI